MQIYFSVVGDGDACLKILKDFDFARRIDSYGAGEAAPSGSSVAGATEIEPTLYLSGWLYNIEIPIFYWKICGKFKIIFLSHICIQIIVLFIYITMKLVYMF